MSIIPKSSFLYPIFKYKCPRCREGDLYETSIFSLKGLFKMREKCPVCGQPYVLEPGFYWGAMYIAYGLAGGVMLAGYTLLSIITDWSVWPKFFTMVAFVFLLYGWVFRTARAVWITLYVGYKGNEAIETYNKQQNKTKK